MFPESCLNVTTILKLEQTVRLVWSYKALEEQAAAISNGSFRIVWARSSFFKGVRIKIFLQLKDKVRFSCFWTFIISENVGHFCKDDGPCKDKRSPLLWVGHLTSLGCSGHITDNYFKLNYILCIVQLHGNHTYNTKLNILLNNAIFFFLEQLGWYQLSFHGTNQITAKYLAMLFCYSVSWTNSIFFFLNLALNCW